jgi:hypothetical protein
VGGSLEVWTAASDLTKGGSLVPQGGVFYSEGVSCPNPPGPLWRSLVDGVVAASVPGRGGCEGGGVGGGGGEDTTVVIIGVDAAQPAHEQRWLQVTTLPSCDWLTPLLALL